MGTSAATLAPRAMPPGPRRFLPPRRGPLSDGVPTWLYESEPNRKEPESAVTDEDEKRVAHRALVDSVRNGPGSASLEQRANAFAGAGLPPPLDTLIGKVLTRADQITDADFDAAKAAGFSEDQLFELVVCAAMGRSTRLYEAGLAALAAADADTAG